MQTFLPYPGFLESARVLDRQRLGKQRVEAWQILCALRNGGGWRNHPATIMWSKYPEALALYGETMCHEWKSRGYTDNMAQRFIKLNPASKRISMPWWLSDPAFHAAHRSNLLRKAPDHYGRFEWKEKPDLPYIWPAAEKPIKRRS